MCTDAGPGTWIQPYCTISAGLAAAAPGDTVQVSSGTYRESPVVRRSGAAGSPIVLTAAPQASVTVTGGSYGLSMSGRSWFVAQGLRIIAPTGAGVLVVNSSNITIRNMTVGPTPGGKGIYVSGSNAVTLSQNQVSYAGQPISGASAPGIQLSATNNSLVIGNQSDHNTDAGISLVTGSTGDQVRNNTTFANARQYQRAAPGIDVRAPDNVIAGNVSYANEDSGIQFSGGGGGNVAYNNLSYNNGDHGIDTLNAPNQTYVANTVYGNATAGINVEGAAGAAASSGATIANNISVDNGFGTFGQKGNIRVDANSLSGSTLNYDLVYLDHAGTMIVWGNSTYPSLAAAQTATGQEAHGLQGNPLFRLPVAGDFQLAEGSPAIDSANLAVPGEPSTDAAGNPRVDDPATPNTGAGAVAYADRGAIEFQPPPTGSGAPVAVLRVTPTSGAAPLTVTADASGSSSGAPIESYQVVFGDGVTSAPQSSPTINYTYPCEDSGTFTLTLIVIDTAGLTGTASVQVTVAPGNLVCNPGFETDTSGWQAAPTGIILTRPSPGHTGNYAAAVTNANSATAATCTLRDAAPHWVAVTGAATYQGSLWVRADSDGATLRLRLREYGISGAAFYGSQSTAITLSTSWQQVSVSYTANAPGQTYLEFSAYTENAPPGTCFYADDAALTVP